MKERFEQKYIKTAACWEWTAAKNDKGYGKFSVAKSKWEYAHRISHKLYKGEIPDKMCVCHKCDNTSCVNPQHLFVGTYSDNNKDAFNKGRHTNPIMKGKDNPRFKFTEQMIKEIQERIKKGEVPKNFHKKYGVHWGSIYRMLRIVNS